MDITRVYSRIVQSESDTYPRVSKQNEEYIYSQLHHIYRIYQTSPKLKVYLRRLINHELFGGNFYRLRDEGEMRDNFYNLIRNLHDYLHPPNDEDWSDSEFEESWKENNWNALGDYILGYIFLRDINFQDDHLTDYNFTLIGRINEWKLADHYHTQIYVYKSEQTFKWGRKTLKYLIPFRKVTPNLLLQFAMYDGDLMEKSHYLYLQKHIYKNLTKEEKGFVKEFVDRKKSDLIQLFQASRDGVLPFIPKDMAGLINDMLYPELDQTKIVRKIVKKCEDKYWKFVCEIENDKSKDIQEEYTVFRPKIIRLVDSLFCSFNEVKGKWKDGSFRQEIMQILSFIFRLEEFEVVKHFNKVEKIFQKIYGSKEDVIAEALDWKEEEGEDVDWFLDIIQGLK